MKNFLLLTFSLAMVFSGLAQGIEFEQNDDWDVARAKALKENKLMYIDFYTDWCGPCKIMAKTFFPDPAIGEAFNAKFVNLKIDAEKGEGIDKAKQYKVIGYPTLVFVNPKDESVVLRKLGSPGTVDEFVSLADDVVTEYQDPMSFEDYVAKFESGDYDEEFLKKIIEKSNRLGEDNTPFVDAYFDEWRKDNDDPEQALEILKDMKIKAGSKFFSYLDEHSEELLAYDPEFIPMMLDKTYDFSELAIASKDNEELRRVKEYLTKYSDQPLMDIFYVEDSFYKLDPEGYKVMVLNTAPKVLAITPEQMAEMNEEGISSYDYQIRAQLAAMGVDDKAKQDSLVKVNFDLHPEYSQMGLMNISNILNQMAWTVYEGFGEDKELTTKALEWAKKASDMTKDYPSLWPNIGDTYAHLLYVLGDKETAIKIESEVIKVAGDNPKFSVDDFQEFLDEMKGE